MPSTGLVQQRDREAVATGAGGRTWPSSRPWVAGPWWLTVSASLELSYHVALGSLLPGADLGPLLSFQGVGLPVLFRFSFSL